MVSSIVASKQIVQSDANREARKRFPTTKCLFRFLARRRERKTPSPSRITPAVVIAATPADDEVLAKTPSGLLSEKSKTTENASQIQYKAAPTVALDTSTLPDIMGSSCNDKARKLKRDVVRSEEVRVQAEERHVLRMRARRAMTVKSEAWKIPQAMPKTYEKPMEAPFETAKETTIAAPNKGITKLPPDVKIAIPPVSVRSVFYSRPGITQPTPTRADIESGAPSVGIWVDQVRARYPGLSNAIAMARQDHNNLTAALVKLRPLNRRKPWVYLRTLSSTTTRPDFTGFPFLSLPLELRNQMYLDYFEELLGDRHCFNLNTLNPPPITKVCRDLRQESSAVLLSKLPFSICYTIATPPPKRTIPSCIFAVAPHPSLKVLHPCTTAWIRSLAPSARNIRDLRVVCTKRPFVPMLFHLNTHAGQTRLQPWDATYIHNGLELPLLPLVAHPDGKWIFDAEGRVKKFEAPGGVQYWYCRRWRNFEAEDLEERLRGVVETLVQEGGVEVADLEGVGVGVRAVCEADPRAVAVLESVVR